MSKARRVLALVLSMVMLFVFTVTADAASKKTVYVRTKSVFTDYTEKKDGVRHTWTYTYDKSGLLKKSAYKCPAHKLRCTTTYKYGKQSRISRSTDWMRYKGSCAVPQRSKFKSNKSGYITSCKYYASDGSLINAKKYKLNKKNLTTRVKEYDGAGRLSQIRRYTYNDASMRESRKAYSADGKLQFVEEYVYEGNICTVTRTDAEGALIATQIWKYSKDNRLLSITEYDETKDHKLVFKETFKYKKVRTSKAGKVEAQQTDLAEYSF